MNDVDCTRLAELLGHHPVTCLFASGNANATRFTFAPNVGMTDDTLTTCQSCGAMAVGRMNETKAAERYKDGTYSSGAVGTSINQSLISANLSTYSTACWTSHTWFASIISTFPVGPAFFPSMLLGLGGFLPLGKLAGSSMMERVTFPRWRSDSTLEPSFILKWLKP